MRYLAIAVLLLVTISGAYAESTLFKVATVHGANQFTISEGGNQLLFHPQPRLTGYYWTENNGSPLGTLAVNGSGPNGWRDGSRTFAVTDVGFGHPLNTIKLTFDYYMPVGSVGWNYPSINFFVTDGLGRYGIWSPGSGGAQYFTPVQNGDWKTLSMDLTSANTTLNDALGGFAMYEHNGFTNDFSQPYTLMQWGGIKNYKLAGFSSYQRSPAMGWANWGSAWQQTSDAWCPFVIRNGSTSGLPPTISGVTDAGAPALEFVISEGGMKAGWGTKALDGKKVSDIAGYIERYDDSSRFTAGSGPAVAPYLNVWITDASRTKFAVIANEPSNPEWTTNPGSSRNFDWDILKTKTAKVYENTDKSWLPNNGVGLTWNNLADYTILPPTPTQLTAGWPGLGGGAPREIGTNKAYGFNWVFGDTLSNYETGDPGYVVASPAVRAGGPEFNEFGIALIWGDTVCSASSGYDQYQRLIKNVVVEVDGVAYEGEFRYDQLASNVLSLNPTASPLYVKGGDAFTVDLDVSNLTQMVGACQAILGYSSSFLDVANVTAGGGVWNDLIFKKFSIAGEIDTAVGLDAYPMVGTDENGTVAKVYLVAKPDVNEITKLWFRPDVVDEYLTEATFLSTVDSNVVWPVKIDSTDIVIDSSAPLAFDVTADPACTRGDVTLSFGTDDVGPAGVDYYEWYVDGVLQDRVESGVPVTMLSFNDGPYTIVVRAYDMAGNYTDSEPVEVTLDTQHPAIISITAKQNGSILTCPNVAVQGLVDIYVVATDTGTGLAGPPSVTVEGSVTEYKGVEEGKYHYTYTVDANTSNGELSIYAKAMDNAGLEGDAAVSLCVNKNQITGSVELEGLNPPAGGITRNVTFVADGGAAEWTVPVFFAEDASVGSFTLTNVPEGTTKLSAKTAWNLRTKLDVTLVSGQAVVNFTGGELLRGGDLNGSNSINVLDYTLMKINWWKPGTADIDGDGDTTETDYGLMKGNWFQIGDLK